MNEIIRFSLFLFVALLLVSCTKSTNTTSIKISSSSHDNDSIWINLYPYDKPNNHTLKLKLNDGIIELDTFLMTPHFGRISFPTTLKGGKLEYIFSESIEFIIRPEEKIQIKTSFEKDRLTYSINGHHFNEELKKYNMEIAEESKRIHAIYHEIENRFPNELDWSIPGVDSLLKLRIPYRDTIEVKQEKFIVANLENEIAAYLMLYYPKEKVQSLFPLLTEKAKNSTYGKLVSKKMTFWSSLDSGALAPNFKYKTFDNKQISLDSLKGKYVLLDFWGTWCPPCRKEIPDLKMFYNSNKDVLEIVGIACNDKYDSWKNLIIEKEMNWTQILNNPENEDLTKTYDINVFPSKILIDPNGKIVKTINGSGKDTFDELDKLITTANNSNHCTSP